MSISITSDILHDVPVALSHEWIETNGRGGWASSSILGLNTRRYHGLLISQPSNPQQRDCSERVVLVSRVDEVLAIGTTRFEISCNQYPNIIYPSGHLLLKEFRQELFPEFIYALGSARFKKTIVAVHGTDSIVVRYSIENAAENVRLTLNPIVAARSYHSLQHENTSLNRDAHWEKNVLRMQPYSGVPQIFAQVAGAQFTSQPLWYRNVQYREEQRRGFDFEEDLFSYGTLSVSLQREVYLVLSAGRSIEEDPRTLLQREKQRREQIALASPVADECGKTLTLAADKFVSRTRDNQLTIIAGYPWFTDWGRDTMIALPGLCLKTKRHQDARAILQRFAEARHRGLIPNRFSDVGSQPEYNSVDATLWFFVAAYHFFQSTRDKDFVKKILFPAMLDAISWYRQGTDFGIRVHDDGLLAAGDPGTQLTWMDAKVHSRPVTPRYGKVVEINALWINALHIAQQLALTVGAKKSALGFSEDAELARENFENLFWHEGHGYLADVVMPSESGVDHVDWSLRPNQVLALSLPFEILQPQRAKRALEIVRRRLFTPFGLRTLSPDDPRYQGRYEGSAEQRDAAYHQGSVWPWLMGPYLRAVRKYLGLSEYHRSAALVFDELEWHLGQAGVGSISELCDGDPPHTPRGCPFQAWSVGEILWEYAEYVNRAGER